MPVLRSDRARFRAVIFDLDETLLLRQRAWLYTIEESVMSVCGRRVDAAPLADEYRLRPWRNALSILVSQPGEMARCEELCTEIFYRSAMKRLLVHDGMGMALDQLRGERIELGAISHEAHGNALKQVQSTGLDRFLSVLSSTAQGEPWGAEERLTDCLAFLEYQPGDCAFVSGDPDDLQRAAELGFVCYESAWSATIKSAFPRIMQPADLPRLARLREGV